jgi:hypothetical protein
MDLDPKRRQSWRTPKANSEIPLTLFVAAITIELDYVAGSFT